MHTPRQALSPLSGLVALLIVLAGCSGGGASSGPDANGDANPSGSSSPTGTANASSKPTSAPTADPKSEEADYCRKQKPFAGAAADEFGANEVADAYCTMVTLQMEEAFRDDLLRGDSTTLTPSDFAIWTRYMPTETAEEFNASLKTALTPGAAAEDKYDVWSLTFFGALTGSPYEFTDEPAVFDRTYSTAETGYDTVDGRNRLLLDIKFTATMNATKDGTQYLVPIGREIRFALTKNPDPTSTDDGWLIDSWNGQFTVGEPAKRPDDYVGNPEAEPAKD